MAKPKTNHDQICHSAALALQEKGGEMTASDLAKILTMCPRTLGKALVAKGRDYGLCSVERRNPTHATQTRFWYLKDPAKTVEVKLAPEKEAIEYPAVEKAIYAKEVRHRREDMLARFREGRRREDMLARFREGRRREGRRA